MKAKPVSPAGSNLVVMLINDKVTDRRAVQQAQSLREAGFEVEFVSWRHAADDDTRVEGFRIHRVDYAAIEESVYSWLSEILTLAPREKVFGALQRADESLFAELNGLQKALELGIDRLNWNIGRPLRRLLRLGFNQGHSLRARSFSSLNSSGWKVLGQLARAYRRLEQGDVRLGVRRLAWGVAHSRLHYALSERGVYLIQSHDLDTGWLGMRLASSLEVPLVYDAHEIYNEQVGLDADYKKFYRELEPRLMQQSAFWMIPNDLAGDWMVDDYRTKGFSVESPLVLQNTFRLWKSAGRADSLREVTGIPQDVKIALYQGGVTPLRNLDSIVRASALLNDQWQVVYLGDGAEVEPLKKLAGDMLGRKVHFVPAVSQEKLLAYTSSADVGLIPYAGVDVNTLFASPNKLYEYIQAGLPILANKLPFLTKKVEGLGIGRTVDFSDPAVIAASINAVTEAELQRLQARSAEVKLAECWEEEVKPYVNRVLQLGNRQTVV